MSERRTLRRVQVVAGAVLLVGTLAGPAWGHEHSAKPAHGGEGQFLANSQNHPPFRDMDEDEKLESCVSYGGSGVGPAWYGLETAHHGRDSGEPGKRDGCYETDSTPALDVQNPAIG